MHSTSKRKASFFKEIVLDLKIRDNVFIIVQIPKQFKNANTNNLIFSAKNIRNYKLHLQTDLKMKYLQL